jgi:hypothetical protein
MRKRGAEKKGESNSFSLEHMRAMEIIKTLNLRLKARGKGVKEKMRSFCKLALRKCAP